MLIGWANSTYLNRVDSDGKQIQGSYAEAFRMSAKEIKTGGCGLVERDLAGREETLAFAPVPTHDSGCAILSLSVCFLIDKRV